MLDPFMCSGTTGDAARRLRRKFVGIEHSQEYFDLAEKRIREVFRPSPLRSNTTSSRPPELAGLWDSAEDETVAVNPAAADAHRAGRRGQAAAPGGCTCSADADLDNGADQLTDIGLTYREIAAALDSEMPQTGQQKRFETEER